MKEITCVAFMDITTNIIIYVTHYVNTFLKKSLQEY